MTGDVDCVAIIIANDDNNIAGVQFEIDFYKIFTTGLHRSLILFIWTIML